MKLIEATSPNSEKTTLLKLHVFIHPFFHFLQFVDSTSQKSTLLKIIEAITRDQATPSDIQSPVSSLFLKDSQTPEMILHQSQYLHALVQFFVENESPSILIGEEKCTNSAEQAARFSLLRATGYKGNVYCYLTRPYSPTPTHPDTYFQIMQFLDRLKVRSILVGGMYLNTPLSYSTNFSKNRTSDGEIIIDIRSKATETLRKSGCVNGFLICLAGELQGKSCFAKSNLSEAHLSQISMSSNGKSFYSQMPPE